MTVSAPGVRKVTISLPADVLAFADAQARRRGSSRSQVISQALAELQAAEEEALAEEGYRFYAAEAREWASATATAVAEAWGHER